MNRSSRWVREIFLLLFALVAPLSKAGEREFLTAVCCGNEKHAFWLINNTNAKINYVDSNNGWNALHYACKNNLCELATYLLKNRHFKVDQETKDKWYPVHIAARHGSIAILKILKSFNADLSVGLRAKGEYENSFSLAAHKGHRDVALYCMHLMPFAWTTLGGRPSLFYKVCGEMREKLAQEILCGSHSTEPVLHVIVSRWLQKAGCAYYFLQMTPSEEEKNSRLIVSDKEDEIPLISSYSLLVLQYLKFFFYKKEWVSKKCNVRALTQNEKALCKQLLLRLPAQTPAIKCAEEGSVFVRLKKQYLTLQNKMPQNISKSRDPKFRDLKIYNSESL